MVRKLKEIWADSAKRFVILAFVFGTMFSFGVIPWQTPDEYSHLNMIGQEIKNEKLAPTFVSEMNLEQDAIRRNPEVSVNHALLKQAMFHPAQYSRNDVMAHGLTIGCIKHLPAIIGIQAGVILHLPVYWVMQLGELFALSFYVFVGYWTIQLAPTKKRVFEVVMLIPMGLHQAASLNYDAVLLPMCYLFVAYILHLQCVDAIKWKHCIVAVVMLTVIMYIKMPYVLLALLLLTLPFEKFELKLGNRKLTISHPIRCRVTLIILGIIACGLFFYVFKDSYYVKVLSVCVTNYKQTLHLFHATWNNYRDHVVTSMIGTFGWLDTVLPVGFPYVVLTVLVFITMTFDKKPETKISTGTRICLLGTGVLMIIFITMSMINHTILITLYGVEDFSIKVDYQKAIYQIAAIGGLQGRYYLPMLLPVLLGVPESIQISEKRYNILYTIFIIWVLFISVNALWNRYIV